MKLKDYLSLLRRNIGLLVVVTLIGGLAGAATALTLPTTYSARTELFVSVNTSGDPYDLQMGSSFVQERIQTYVDMADSRSVLQPVIDELGLETTPEALASSVTAYSDPRTVLITVDASQSSADAAEGLSGAVADSLVNVIGQMEDPEDEEASQIRLTVSNPPVAPGEPDGLPWWVYAAGGLPIGFAVGLALALARTALDNRLRTREDLQNVSHAPVLGSVPLGSDAREARLISQLGLDDARAEAFRRLRTNLRFAQVDKENSAVLVTSAQAQEGKSSTSINLAIAAAQGGSRVALVDADLRQPTIADKMGLENSAGLTTVLVGAADASDLLQPWGADELYVLTAGEMPPNPVELLDSRAMGALVARLAAEFDLVILDGPPLLPVADALVLAKHVGQVLLVAAVGEVKLSHLQEAVNSLGVVEVPLGTVLNKVPHSADEMRGYSARYPSRAISPEQPHHDEETQDAGSEGRHAAHDTTVKTAGHRRRDRRAGRRRTRQRGRAGNSGRSNRDVGTAAATAAAVAAPLRELEHGVAGDVPSADRHEDDLRSSAAPLRDHVWGLEVEPATQFWSTGSASEVEGEAGHGGPGRSGPGHSGSEYPGPGQSGPEHPGPGHARESCPGSVYAARRCGSADDGPARQNAAAYEEEPRDASAALGSAS